MNALARVLDAESYEWLGGHHPEILDALEKEVAAGKSPRAIKAFVLRYTLRSELALRCEAAARHIEQQQEK